MLAVPVACDFAVASVAATRLLSDADNDNATPVKALSLDVELWMARQGAR